jgi:hypothetical protein
MNKSIYKPKAQHPPLLKTGQALSCWFSKELFMPNG